MLRPTCILVSKGLLPVLLLAWMLASAVKSAADGGQADMERLKQRVTAYFSAVQARRFSQAREFILPRSRDTAAPPRSGKARISNFRIVGVEPEAGNHSAVVTISRLVAGGGISRLKVSEKFRWKKQEGEWFLDPADPPKSDAEIFREYYYEKLGSATKTRFEETDFDFGKAVQGDSVQPRFSFRNGSSQDITVERIHAPDRLIADRTENRLIPAGESGEIRVELNTAKLHGIFVQDFFVQFEPVKEMVKLRITGKVYTPEEVSQSPSLPREAAARKSATPANP